MNTKQLLSLGSLSLLSFAALAWQQAAVKLPPPNATPSATNRPEVIARPEGAQLRVPEGFTVEEVAAGFNNPRYMLLGPGNEVFLSDSSNNGSVYVMPLVNGKPGERKALLEGLKRPYGLAFHQGYLYVTEVESVKRYPYDAKTMKAGAGQEVVSLKGMDKGHWTRTVQFDKQGKMYLGVGSGSNVDAGDPEIRAAISRFNADGTGQEIIASGVRNPIGLRFYPGTNNLYVAVQERDGLGDDLVPDYLTRVQQGGFYGWPYAYIGPNEEPRRKGENPELVKKTLVPDVLLGSHVAVMDFQFYTGKQFPEKYRNGAFMAFHGSGNRSQRVGYQVAFLPFKNGKPAASAPEPFLTGWMLDPDKKEVWGRPVGLCVLPDGSMLVSDDAGKKVWRVSYKR